MSVIIVIKKKLYKSIMLSHWVRKLRQLTAYLTTPITYPQNPSINNKRWRQTDTQTHTQADKQADKTDRRILKK